MTQITMRQGLWCHLQHEGHNIAVHCSLWSGKEVVYVDDHPVSEHRNLFRFMGRHALRLNNQDYTLEVEVENPFTYRTQVRLKKVHVLCRESPYLCCLATIRYLKILLLLPVLPLWGRCLVILQLCTLQGDITNGSERRYC